MKKFLALIIALVMALSLVACGEQGDSQKGDDSASGDKVVKIGVFEPQSGDNGAGGKQEVLGMQYANYVQPTVDWRSSITAPQPRTARPRPLSWSTRA